MGVPPPKGQRGLLVSAAAVVAARSQVEVKELSGMLTHTCMLVSRYSLSSTHVCCCVAWHHTPLPCRLKKQGHWLLENNRRGGRRVSKEALLPCPSS